MWCLALRFLLTGWLCGLALPFLVVGYWDLDHVARFDTARTCCSDARLSALLAQLRREPQQVATLRDLAYLRHVDRAALSASAINELLRDVHRVTLSHAHTPRSLRPAS